MANSRFVQIAEKEALRLFDLVSIQYDIFCCLDLCRVAMNPQRDVNLLTALATAIPVWYGRAFGKSVRGKLVSREELEEAFNAEQIVRHQQFIDYRDKHAAHSTSTLEAQWLTIQLAEEGENEKLIAVAAAYETLGALSSKDYAEWAALCETFLKWIRQKIAVEEAKLKAIILSKYTMEQIRAFESSTLGRTSSLETMKSRASNRDRGRY